MGVDCAMTIKLDCYNYKHLDIYLLYQHGGGFGTGRRGAIGIKSTVGCITVSIICIC